MRELTLEEIELVAGGLETNDSGGDDGDDGDDGDVIVTGHHDNGDSGGGDGSNDDGDDGDGNDSGDQPHTPDCTANHIGEQIKKDIGDNKTPNEYSAFIYKDPVSGNIERSNILPGTEYQAIAYDPHLFGIPDGAVLEGYEHVHPTFNSDGQVLNERAYADNGDLNALQNSAGYAVPGHNITVDVNNFASYILHDTTTNGTGWVVDKYTHSETVGKDYSGQPTTIRLDTPPVSTSDLNNPSC